MYGGLYRYERSVPLSRILRPPHLTCLVAREGGGDIAGTVGYGLNASIALSVNTGMAFMTVLLWSLLALL